jgi:PEP-CTERM motif-containing protein
VQKISCRAALLASVLIVSTVSVSRAETLDFSYVDSDGDKASWVQQSNPVCPGPGGCSFFPGPITGALVPVIDGVESFSGGGGDTFTSVGFYAASSDGGFALTVLNTRQPTGYQLFNGTTAAPDFSALLAESPIVNLYVEGTSITGTLTVAAAGVPEPSMWVMMLIGFAGLGFAGYRASHKSAAIGA